MNVRKTFELNLPHIDTIRRWYSSVDGSPGFSEESFASLGRKVQAGDEVICALMLDEMAIKKQVQWDGKRVHGFVDIGNGVFNDSAPPATDALVLMAVAGKWLWVIS